MAKIATMRGIKNGLFLMIATAAIAACTSKEVNKPSDNLSSGTIDISVDESFQPIIAEQLKVFDSSSQLFAGDKRVEHITQGTWALIVEYYRVLFNMLPREYPL